MSERAWRESESLAVLIRIAARQRRARQLLLFKDLAFDSLPILADALEDAGCGDDQVLGHCRGIGDHFASCWLLDGVLRPG
jgi:hypothetical protein